MRKERRFFSADAGADLQNDVAVVIRVTRQQQDAQLLLELRAAGPVLLDLLARDLVQLRVAQQRLRLRDLRLTGGIRPVGLHDRLQLALLAAELCEHRRVGIVRGVGQLALKLGISVFNLSQLFEHSAASLVAIFAQYISLPQRHKNVNRPQRAKSAGHRPALLAKTERLIKMQNKRKCRLGKEERVERISQ